MWNKLIFIFLITLFIIGCSKNTGFEGKIIDADSKPIKNLKIIAQQIEPIKGYEKFETTTGTDGTFRFAELFPSSDYTLLPKFTNWSSIPQRTLKYESNRLTARFNRKGWMTSRKLQLTSGPEGQIALLKSPIVISPTFSTVVGKVVDGKSTPMPNITVSATLQKRNEPGYQSFQTITNSKGRFSFEKLLPFSKYSIRPSSKQWSTNTIEYIHTGQEQSTKTTTLKVRFIKEKDVVIDTRNNLMWSASAKKLTKSWRISWYDAKSYCENFKVGGYNDWHLPSLNEIRKLYTNANYTPGENARNIIIIHSCYLWTSTVEGKKAHLYVQPGCGFFGDTYLEFKTYTKPQCAVLPVRTIK